MIKINCLAQKNNHHAVNPSPDKPPYTIGIDLSILQRVKTGTSVYAESLYHALDSLDQDDFEFVSLHSPKPLPRKNLLTKFYNFFLDIIWLTVLLPIKVRTLHIDLLHMPANVISPFLRKPQICSIHDAHFLTNPQGRDPLWRLYASFSFRYAARHATRILCDSNHAKNEVVNFLGAKPEKVDVIPLGLPHRISRVSDNPAVSVFRPYILSVGATEPHKNFQSLVKAYAKLVNMNDACPYNLVLAGPPGHDHHAVEKLIQSRNIADKVKLLGLVSDSKLAALYENASLFVFPSLCEGFGFPPLEAMHHKVPVLASNSSCIPETLDKAALYFDPHDINEMAEKMHLILSNNNLREKLVQAGSLRAREFTWEKTAKKTLAIYRLLLQQGHR